MRIYLFDAELSDVFSTLFQPTKLIKRRRHSSFKSFFVRVPHKTRFSLESNLERMLQQKGLLRLESLYFYECDENSGKQQAHTQEKVFATLSWIIYTNHSILSFASKWLGAVLSLEFIIAIKRHWFSPSQSKQIDEHKMKMKNRLRKK